MAIAAPGIGSNLDVNSIVSQLVNIERQPITALDRREAGIQARITAFGSIRGALSSFQTATRGLSDAGRFLAFKATSGDSTIATVSATAKAATASFALDVTSLAQAQKLTVVGQASTNAAIGNGTLTFDFGKISGGSFDSNTGKYTGATFANNGGGSKSVTIDGSNSSLQGIRDAINSAKVGVTASIVNDGDANAPHRLVLSSDTLGVSNSIKITVSGDAALSNLLAQDPQGAQQLSQSIAAQNAIFKVDGVAISKNSNTVTDVIEGVSFTLLKAASNTTLSVSRDTQAVQSSVQAFVKAYNDVNKVLTDLSAYNPVTQRGAILQGDSAVRNIQNQIRSTLTSTLSGLGGNLTLLSDVGVAFQKDGTLALDSAKLQSAIDGNFSDIASLFAAVGKGTDSLVAFAASGTNTRPGNYAVSLTQLATQGKTLGNRDVSGGVTITGANNNLVLNVDSVATTITLNSGTYTAAALALEIQSKINGSAAISSAGSTVAVTVSGNNIAVNSARYGSTSKVSFTSGNAKADIFGTTADTLGVDVAGSIGGVAATGSGQALTGTGAAEGLRLNITGGSLGSRGSVNFSQGYAFQLNKLVDNFVGTSGVIPARTEGLAKSVVDIGDRRNALNLRLNSLEQRLRAQFTALDQLVSRISSTGAFLTQQLSNLPGFTR